MVGCKRLQTKSTKDLLERITLAWVDVFGGVETRILDGEAGMMGKEVDDWAVYSQIAMMYNVPHQQAWLVERHDALIRAALQRVESQVIKQSVCAGFTPVLGVSHLYAQRLSFNT